MENFNKELKEKNEYAKQAIEMKNSQIYELKIEIDEKDLNIKNLQTNLVENVCISQHLVPLCNLKKYSF